MKSKRDCEKRAGRRRRPSFRPEAGPLEVRLLLSTLIVKNAADNGPGTLRDAVASAQSGDTITFARSLNGQTINLTSGELDLATSLDIEGPGAGKLTINAAGSGRAFFVSGGASAIDGLTITGGSVSAPDHGLSFAAAGAVLVDGGSLSLVGDVLSLDSVTNPAGLAAGGAVAAVGASSVSLSGTTVAGSVASGLYAEGGGLAALNGARASIAIGSFDGDVATGGLYALGGGVVGDGSPSLAVSGMTFNGDVARGQLPASASGVSPQGDAGGGAIAVVGGSTAGVSGSAFSDNQAVGSANNPAGGSAATGSGGAIDIEAVSLAATGSYSAAAPADLSVAASTLSGNVARGGDDDYLAPTTSYTYDGYTYYYPGANSAGAGSGGAIAASGGGNVTISGSALSGNRAVGGVLGPAYNGSQFGYGVAAGGFGGAIDLSGVSSTIAGSIVSGNSAEGDQPAGGAIEAAGGSLTISGTSLSGNVSGDSGGAVEAHDGSLLIAGSSVSNNMAQGSGSAGGAVGAISEVATVVDSIVSGDVAASGGGIFAYAPAAQIAQDSLTLTADLFEADRTSDTSYVSQGGAVFSFVDTTVTGSVFRDNLVDGIGESRGGALSFQGDPNLSGPAASASIIGCLIEGNQARSDLGSAFGGGLDEFAMNLTVAETVVSGNQSIGGNGPASSDEGGYGGYGGYAYGGGIDAYPDGQSLTITNSAFVDNLAQGGSGGAGGPGSAVDEVAPGVGGPGGPAFGGGLSLTASQTTNIAGTAFVGNRALAGAGGAGGEGGPSSGSGGVGGAADGGAVSAFTSRETFTDCLVADNASVGGAGGASSTGLGGLGGRARGGGISDRFGIIDQITVDGGAIVGNSVASGAGGSGTFGGDADRAEGGGIFMASGGTVTVLGATVSSDRALGGAGGTGGSGGSEGAGGLAIGGGIAGLGASISLSHATLSGDLAAGGASPGDSGGSADGGGLFNVAFSGYAASTTIADSAFSADSARGGAGTTGGDGFGGGVYSADGFLGDTGSASLAITGASSFVFDEALAGLADESGIPGDGYGGGVAVVGGSGTIAPSVAFKKNKATTAAPNLYVVGG